MNWTVNDVSDMGIQDTVMDDMVYFDEKHVGEVSVCKTSFLTHVECFVQIFLFGIYFCDRFFRNGTTDNVRHLCLSRPQSLE